MEIGCLHTVLTLLNCWGKQRIFKFFLKNNEMFHSTVHKFINHHLSIEILFCYNFVIL